MQPATPTPPQPMPVQSHSRVGLWVVVLVVLVLAGAGTWFYFQRTDTENQPTPPSAEERVALQAFEESKAQQRLANLEGIHLLIAKYLQEHGNYPSQLSDLTDIKGYAPGVAKMISETKLDDGRPAYTYAKSEGSYQLCANQKNAEPKCEGPR